MHDITTERRHPELIGRGIGSRHPMSNENGVFCKVVSLGVGVSEYKHIWCVSICACIAPDEALSHTSLHHCNPISIYENSSHTLARLENGLETPGDHVLPTRHLELEFDVDKGEHVVAALEALRLAEFLDEQENETKKVRFASSE
ncbi:hypothetical protein NUW58_g10108 [Xylaria curta]|uniref:Uncharacterized protein n=1 Tax=Xylaria curta TaxID=42375 RepID=A0ACC1MPJ8_9PEZI|nr:hypothetical protein NUW58_g10108 [Xylaria curta]